jgi:hypothetical protein
MLNVFRISTGYLFGFFPEPTVASPCAGCIEKWLLEQKEFPETATVEEIAIRQDLIKELEIKKDPHILYEMTPKGESIKHESLVFAHPNCSCNKANYILPQETEIENLTLNFSPIKKTISARIASPTGNKWLTCYQSNTLTAYGASANKAESRKLALLEFIKKYFYGLQTPQKLLSEFGRHFLSNESVFQSSGLNENSYLDAEGVGFTAKEALMNSLHELAKQHTLKRFANLARNPMLIIGAENWIREQLPFYVLQNYDVHMLFYPNSMPSWVIGIIAINRKTTESSPVFVFSSGPGIFNVIEDALNKLLIHIRPEEGLEEWPLSSIKVAPRNSKLNTWWNAWVYRCVKITLKDILHLEDYANEVQVWKDYFKDGQQEVLLLQNTSPFLPTNLFHIQRIRIKLDVQIRKALISGIGTLHSMGLS